MSTQFAANTRGKFFNVFMTYKVNSLRVQSSLGIGGGGGGRLANKGRHGCAGQGIRYFRGQFLSGH